MSVARLLIAYDGAGFSGWARQPGRRTVQGVVEDALASLRGGQAVALTVAGRTDAGVHALGQVASYEGDPVPLGGLHALLPPDVAALACDAAPTGFDARRWARTRSYRYRILTRRTPSPFEQGRALWWPHALDRDALDACAAALAGEHDFTAFTPAETDHVRFSRIVSAAAWKAEDDDVLAFTITADAFLRQMNRILVGTMLEVAGGRRTPDEFTALLDGAPRAQAGRTAPPHGLYLESVSHGDGPTPWVDA